MEYGYTIDENTEKHAGLYLTEFPHLPRVGEEGWVGESLNKTLEADTGDSEANRFLAKEEGG